MPLGNEIININNVQSIQTTQHLKQSVRLQHPYLITFPASPFPSFLLYNKAGYEYINKPTYCQMRIESCTMFAEVNQQEKL